MPTIENFGYHLTHDHALSPAELTNRKRWLWVNYGAQIPRPTDAELEEIIHSRLHHSHEEVL